MLDHIILCLCATILFCMFHGFLRLYYSVLCAKLLDLSPTHFRLIGKVKLKINWLEREGMDFDDSFFEDSDECEEDNSTSTEKVLYTVKRCESEVSAPCGGGKNGLNYLYDFTPPCCSSGFCKTLLRVHVTLRVTRC